MGDMQLRGEIVGADGTAVPFLASKTGAQRVALANSRYFDTVMRRNVFGACNQGATTWSVALATTHTGFVLSNPPNSGFDLVPIAVQIALAAAPVAIAPILLMGGFAVGGITAHTTPLSVFSAAIEQDQQAGGIGKADAAATLVGTPRYLLPLVSGFTAGALPAMSPQIIDLGGMFVVPPGGYIGIAAVTAISAIAGMLWEEIPRLPA